MKAHVRRYRSYRRNELCSENLYKTLVGTDCEAPFQLGEVKTVDDRTQHGMSILGQLMHSIAQVGSVWSRHHAATRTHKQRVSRRRP
jgi:hypothetical protein